VPRREQFTIPQATEQYLELIKLLPTEFVGSPARLVPLAQLLCSEMGASFAARGLACPPWRQAKSLLSKWLPAKVRLWLHGGGYHMQCCAHSAARALSWYCLLQTAVPSTHLQCAVLPQKSPRSFAPVPAAGARRGRGQQLCQARLCVGGLRRLSSVACISAEQRRLALRALHEPLRGDAQPARCAWPGRAGLAIRAGGCGGRLCGGRAPAARSEPLAAVGLHGRARRAPSLTRLALQDPLTLGAQCCL